MFNIADYLQKFKKISDHYHGDRNIVVEAIYIVCGIRVSLNNITIKKGIVFIHEKPIVKNEIFMRKEKILAQVKESGVLNIVAIK